MINEELKPCPFCGGKAKIGISDDEGNNRDAEYENDPWSGLSYRIAHSYEENKNCPIATYECDGASMGVYLYDSREEAIEAWNSQMSEHTVREPVKWFAEQMEQRLKDNDHKTGWKDSSYDWLIARLYQEANRLWRAIDSDASVSYEKVIREAADVANFAMMIADNARRFVKVSEPSE